MSTPEQVPDKPDTRERTAAALEQSVGKIKTAAQAARTLASLEQAAAGWIEADVARTTHEPAIQEGQLAIEGAPGGPKPPESGGAIAAVAIQSAMSPPEGKPLVDDAVSQVLGGADEADAPPERVRRGRRLLRDELIRRLGPLQALDAFAFVQINQLPHTRLSDALLSRLSWVMTGGTGWLLFLVVAMVLNRQRGWRATCAVAPALWLATSTVEYPIKKWFRRRRPFISLIHAIIVGRRPGSYSFPSGHSAAAFAGALLLSREYPGGARGFFGLALLVAFSRIHLGAHYPGDVVSGSLLGSVLAHCYSCALRGLGIAKQERACNVRRPARRQ